MGALWMSWNVFAFKMSHKIKKRPQCLAEVFFIILL